MGRDAPYYKGEREMRGMNHTKQAWWLTLTGTILGFEGESTGDGGTGGSGEGGSGNEGTGEGSQGSGQGEGGTGDGGNSTDDDTQGLKSALQKEREGRKALEKELARFRKAEQAKADAEKTEVQRLTDQQKREADKVAKLAQGFRDSAVRAAVIAEATKLNFLDPADAMRPEVLDALGVEQDEDDPTKIEIDSAALTKALKDLAKNKPHYLRQGEGKKTPPRSGSQFGGGANNGKIDPNEVLMKRYPALQGRVTRPQ